MSRLQETQNIDAQEVIEALKKDKTDLGYLLTIRDIRIKKLEELVLSIEEELNVLKLDKSNK